MFFCLLQSVWIFLDKVPAAPAHFLDAAGGLPTQQLFGLAGVGVAGGDVACAAAHNLGQMAAAVFISRTSAILYYLPVLLVSGIVTGIFTGLCAQLVSKRARQAGLFSK